MFTADQAADRWSCCLMSSGVGQYGQWTSHYDTRYKQIAPDTTLIGLHPINIDTKSSLNGDTFWARTKDVSNKQKSIVATASKAVNPFILSPYIMILCSWSMAQTGKINDKIIFGKLSTLQSSTFRQFSGWWHLSRQSESWLDNIQGSS